MSMIRKPELVDATTDPVVTPFAQLCQGHSKEGLIIPKYEGYSTMAQNLAEHSELPSGIRNLDQLDDGSGLLQDM